MCYIRIKQTIESNEKINLVGYIYVQTCSSKWSFNPNKKNFYTSFHMASSLYSKNQQSIKRFVWPV